MRYFAKVAYDGYDFLGFQKQKGKRSIQGEIEKILSQIFNQEITIHGSGRTDKQVHALGQYFHFEVNQEVDVERLTYSVNRMITPEIHLAFIKKVSENFHARFSAIEKQYQYLISIKDSDPFKRRYHYQIKETLDVELMKHVAKEFIGTHNFKCFTSKQTDEQDFVRTITSLELQFDDRLLSMQIAGNGFMRYMVRMVFGVLVAIGLGKESPSLVKELLMSQNRNVTRHKLPGHGLYLVDVFYDKEGDKQ